MNCEVEITIETHVKNGEQEAIASIEQALNEAAQLEQCPIVEVALLIVDNEKIQELNREFRQIDRATDVLSFPQWEADEEWIVEEGNPVTLGDIVISLPKAREQAESFGHSLKRELNFLAVHGFLHLLGYDHANEAEETEMFAKQEEVLTRVGLRR